MKGTKVLKWHGNKEQMNIATYHLLQSCGVHVVSHLKTKVNETHCLASTESSRLENPGFHSP